MIANRGTCKHEVKTVYIAEGIAVYECGVNGHAKCDKGKCGRFERANGNCLQALKEIKKGLSK